MIKLIRRKTGKIPLYLRSIQQVEAMRYIHKFNTVTNNNLFDDKSPAILMKNY